MSTGTRYLGGFIGDDSERLQWVEEKVKKWVEDTEKMAEIAC